MAFVSIKEMGAKSNRGGRNSSDSDVVFATDCAARDEKKTYQMRVAISPAIAKQARIIAGDKVLLLFDKENNLGLIKRVPDGWTLSSQHGGKRLIVKITWIPGFPTVATATGCPAEVTDEGIVFVLPEKCSFDRNLRAEYEVSK